MSDVSEAARPCSRAGWLPASVRGVAAAFARSVRGRALGVQWLALLLWSVAFTAALEVVHVPAAFLLGPMLAAAAVATSEARVAIPAGPVLLAEGLIGCLIARSIPLHGTGGMLEHWPLLLAGPVPVIAASTLLGWLLTRWRVLPGTAAIWGSSPGAALAMTLMADAHGADARLVAFMQYLRMACVALTASVVARLWTAGAAQPAAALVMFPPVAWGPLAQTIALAALGALLARVLRIRGGPLLLPLAAGVTLQATTGIGIELPPWLLAACYAVIGWSIGLRFTRPLVAYTVRALPRILLSIAALIAICGLVAVALSVALGVDPLTAYLATSPGGADSVAIIAASSKVDVPFVMGMQTARFVLVVLTGPPIARFVSSRVAGPPDSIRT